MSFRLRENLHWCECVGRIVFLDLASDRYFCLPARANKAFLALAAGRAGEQDIEHLGILVARGFLVEGLSPEPFRLPATIENPTHDYLSDRVPRSSPAALLCAVVREAAATWQLRTRRFSEVIALAGQRDVNTRRRAIVSGRTILSAAAAADRIALVTRSHNRCLVRALALHAACRSRGIAAKLVLGVIAHPFAAHSWVQLGDAVLVGGYEQARLYTPILVVE